MCHPSAPHVVIRLCYWSKLPYKATCRVVASPACVALRVLHENVACESIAILLQFFSSPDRVLTLLLDAAIVEGVAPLVQQCSAVLVPAEDGFLQLPRDSSWLVARVAVDAHLADGCVSVLLTLSNNGMLRVCRLSCGMPTLLCSAATLQTTHVADCLHNDDVHTMQPLSLTLPSSDGSALPSLHRSLTLCAPCTS